MAAQCYKYVKFSARLADNGEQTCQGVSECLRVSQMPPRATAQGARRAIQLHEVLGFCYPINESRMSWPR